MYVTHLRKIDDSVMVSVPSSMLESLHLTAGSRVEISVRDHCLVIEPEARPRYTLGELLAQCDPAQPITPEDEAWLGAPAMGRELL